ncbi:MAG: shikimate kinase [Clostridia bacterium]|nr:shikimate kinase [Clostridia bacterium]
MNIILIGMPGCGKSTIGVILAKTLLLDFLDTDLIIQNKYGKALYQIINDLGTNEFKSIENNIISQIECENCVIATGGSAVYGEKAMQNLKKDGKIIYLKLPEAEIINRLNNIKTRGIVIEKGHTINQLYLERTPLYEKYADITVDCSGLTAEECVEKIIEKLKADA